MCGQLRGGVTKHCGQKDSDTIRDCPGEMPRNRHLMVRAPIKLICKRVRAIGQMRVHCVNMQIQIVALRYALENSHARHDVVYLMFSFLSCDALTM